MSYIPQHSSEGTVWIIVVTEIIDGNVDHLTVNYGKKEKGAILSYYTLLVALGFPLPPGNTIFVFLTHYVILNRQKCHSSYRDITEIDSSEKIVQGAILPLPSPCCWQFNFEFWYHFSHLRCGMLDTWKKMACIFFFISLFMQQFKKYTLAQKNRYTDYIDFTIKKKRSQVGISSHISCIRNLDLRCRTYVERTYGATPLHISHFVTSQ